MNILDDLKLQYKQGGITIRLIFWNIGCFLITLPFFYHFQEGLFDFPYWLALKTDPSQFILAPWTFVTYSFFHDGVMHLLFNLLVLNFSSQLFLTFFTQKQFLGLYILGGIFSGLVFAFIFNLLNINSTIVGASAAIMAILVATTTYQPLMNVRLFLFGNVKLWYLTAFILIIDLLQFKLDNMGGHIAHFSGAFFGFIFIKLLQNGIDLSKIITYIIDFFKNIFTKSEKTPFKKVHKNYNQQTVTTKGSRIVKKDETQQKIDIILDKISKSGYESLNKEEKEFLFKVGK